MSKVVKLLLAAAVLLCLPGCWDMREIQEISYVTALGVDYRDNEYIIYAQLLDFTSVAKSESGKTSESIPVWVGRGHGKTLNDAISKLYTTNQQQISWSHVTALVMTESIMDPKRMEKIFDLTNRSNEIRYTKWVFGTRNKIEDLFTTTPFFQLSPLHSLLHEPAESYKQYSFVHPIQFSNFISSYRERGATVVLPSLSVSTANWTENLKQHPLLEFDGAYFLHNKKKQTWLPREDILGLRWLASVATSAPIQISENNDELGSIIMKEPRSAIEMVERNGEVSFRIKLNLIGMIRNMDSNVQSKKMKELGEKALEDQITRTFRIAARNGVDPYQFSQHLYRYDNKLWHKLDKEGSIITDESLEDVQVNLSLRFWGQRKDLKQ